MLRVRSPGTNTIILAFSKNIFHYFGTFFLLSRLNPFFLLNWICLSVLRAYPFSPRYVETTFPSQGNNIFKKSLLNIKSWEAFSKVAVFINKLFFQVKVVIYYIIKLGKHFGLYFVHKFTNIRSQKHCVKAFPWSQIIVP